MNVLDKLRSLCFERSASKAEPAKGMNITFSTPLMILTAFLAGLLIALCLCWMAESYLMQKTIVKRLALAGSIAGRPASFASIAADEGFKELAALNPFGAATPPVPEKTEATEALPVSSLSLAGTLPKVAAWISDGSETMLYLTGQDVRGFTLTGVEYEKVTLAKEGKSYPLYLFFSGGLTPSVPARQTTASSTTSRPRPSTASQPKFDGIVTAEDGRDGVVPRELVDTLLMNPYDEMGKMRMVPAEGGGVQLQQIQSDSVLAQVGVVQGDVIKAINGIEISNLGDMANAVNSLMSGARFDVMVEREGNPVDLNYQVN